MSGSQTLDEQIEDAIWDALYIQYRERADPYLYRESGLIDGHVDMKRVARFVRGRVLRRGYDPSRDCLVIEVEKSNKEV